MGLAAIPRDMDYLQRTTYEVVRVPLTLDGGYICIDVGHREEAKSMTEFEMRQKVKEVTDDVLDDLDAMEKRELAQLIKSA